MQNYPRNKPHHWKWNTEKLLQFWTKIQKWALEYSNSLIIKYEDLTQQPLPTMEKIYQYLELEYTSKIQQRIQNQIKREGSLKTKTYNIPPLELNSETQDLLQQLGY